MTEAPSTSSLSTILHYLDFNPDGSPSIVLLHGLGADCSSWGYQIPALCEAGLRPLAPDLPGFGKSLPGAARWNIARAAGDVIRLLVALNIPRARIVGISMGGAVALQLALDFPQWVEKLVLVNTFACLRPKRWDELSYLAGRFVVANLRGKEYQAQAVAKRLFPNPGQEQLRVEITQRILQSDERVYRQAMRALALFNVRGRLSEIQAPTLVISGERDTTVPLANQRELAEGIPGARQVVIPDAGHAVIADQPARFNRELLDFVA